MDIAEAFQLLGLDKSANQDEIDQRFRQLSLEYHPDVSGSDEDMIALSEARRIAKDFSSRSRDLVPAEIVEGVVARMDRQAEERRVRERRFEAATTSLRNNGRSRLQSIRNTAFLAGAVSAGAFLFGKDILNEFFPGMDIVQMEQALNNIIDRDSEAAQRQMEAIDNARQRERFISLIRRLFFLTGVAAGFISFWFSYRLRNVEQDLDQLSYDVQDKQFLYPVFHDVERRVGTRVWTRSDLQSVLESPGMLPLSYRALAATTGTQILASYLIDAGIQLNVIASNEEVSGGEYEEYFSIRKPDKLDDR